MQSIWLSNLFLTVVEDWHFVLIKLYQGCCNWHFIVCCKKWCRGILFLGVSIILFCSVILISERVLLEWCLLLEIMYDWFDSVWSWIILTFGNYCLFKCSTLIQCTEICKIITILLSIISFQFLIRLIILIGCKF